MAAKIISLIRLLTNPDDAILNGEDRQRSKASAPRMARLEPTWMYLQRLYDLPVLSVAGTLSITSLIFLISFSTLAAEVNQNKVQQKNNLENFALSICLAEGFPDGEINSEAFSAVGAYVELGAYPVEAYEEVSELAKKFLEKKYISKNGESKLTVMKCIDLSQSSELSAIKDKYTRHI
ncbi:acetyltransferase [Yersinia pseudotuberculosis]|nr:putative exported protein [Yersinia pseudotuberculosis]AJJ05738.1 putative exported protein [Yersinia pseudotuberculosis]SUQ16670.1 acetyltransferase [Yersinia pseudotuberculosis]